MGLILLHHKIQQTEFSESILQDFGLFQILALRSFWSIDKDLGPGEQGNGGRAEAGSCFLGDE